MSRRVRMAVFWLVCVVGVLIVNGAVLNESSARITAILIGLTAAVLAVGLMG